MELDGARVLVCGGGRRLGRAIAEDLAAAGCSMAVSSRSAVAPVAVRETRTTIALRGDLGDAVQARAVVEDAATALGGLDGIVYAAGGAFTPMALADITPELVEDALGALVSGLARALAPRLRVNVIHPGTVLPPDEVDASALERIVTRIPLGRIGSPDDIAGAVRYLLTAEYVTGTELVVDGGRLAQ
jgi:pteridine reductase